MRAIQKTIPARPPVIEVWVEPYLGPHWGGGLYSHGLDVVVLGRTDGGDGAWLRPETWPGDQDALAGAVGCHVDEDGNLDITWDQLTQTLTTAFPDATLVFNLGAVDRKDLGESEVPVLLQRNFTRDCLQSGDGDE